jgi:hypothetical protein
VHSVNIVNSVYTVNREGNNLPTKPVRVPDKDIPRLDRICRKVAEIKNKPSVHYPEAISFLIDKYEESEK